MISFPLDLSCTVTIAISQAISQKTVQVFLIAKLLHIFKIDYFHKEILCCIQLYKHCDHS